MQERTFGTLLVIGLSLNICLQALVNMGVAVNVLPVTGLALPMLSMGGTSILFNAIAVGIIISISREAEESKQAIVSVREENLTNVVSNEETFQKEQADRKANRPLQVNKN
jgi:cell division protein FtsW